MPVHTKLYIQESVPPSQYEMINGKHKLATKKYQELQAIDSEKPSKKTRSAKESNSNTALAMLYDNGEFLKGEGYYLYCPHENCRVKTSIISEFVQYILNWKSIAVSFIIFMITWFLSPLIKEFKFVRSSGKVLTSSNSELEKLVQFDSFNYNNNYLSENLSNAKSEVEINTYRSRYLEDFEPIHCLGKGGFGLVFEARHKVDDCHYAVKRITLPSKDESRDRVLREVKALAKLDHRFIVRYFHSWQECPPIGWQENQDKLWKKDKNINDFFSSEESEETKISGNTTSIVPNTTQSGVKVSGSNNCSSFPCIEYENNDFEITNNEDETSFIQFKHCEDSCGDATLSSAQVENQIKTTSNTCQKSTNKNPKFYLYIQMQLCQRNSLREWLCNNIERDTEIVLKMFDQIVQAVEYVHNQGLIHRDLKPSNIFFAQDGQIKVGDFGLVTEIYDVGNRGDNEHGGKWDDDPTRTANAGTKLYMSPEQTDGLPYNSKVDIYSLGIILFELLISFSTQMERIYILNNLRHKHFPTGFDTKYKKEYQLLSKMLSSDPATRPTAFEIRSHAPFDKFLS